MHQFAGINVEVEELKKELEAEYGSVNIDIEDGTYTKVEKKELEVVE